MPRLLMLRGVPGSGKSTLARNLVEKDGYVRVNKDDLRAMLDNSKTSKHKEALILAVRDSIISRYLLEGKNVVVDDTNINPKHEKTLRAMAESLKVSFEIKHFFDIPLKTCIEQDLKRLNSVGEQVIRRMYREAQENYPECFPKDPTVMPYTQDPNLPTCIICDLDGTLALLNGRNPFDASTCEQDLLNEPVQDVAHSALTVVDEIIFMSGRSDKYETQTRTWLSNKGWDDYELIMRSEGDFRKDCIVKQELFDKHIRGKYNVHLVLDDRQQVVDMWRSLGLTCFQVAPGDF